eukprot:scaffold68543_cov55-Phaeocystis_antarctica.AAC.4
MAAAREQPPVGTPVGWLCPPVLSPHGGSTDLPGAGSAEGSSSAAARLCRGHEAAVQLLALEGAMALLHVRPLDHLLGPDEAVVRPVGHARAVVAEDEAVEARRLVELEGHPRAAPRPAPRAVRHGLRRRGRCRPAWGLRSRREAGLGLGLGLSLTAVPPQHRPRRFLGPDAGSYGRLVHLPRPATRRLLVEAPTRLAPLVGDGEGVVAALQWRRAHLLFRGCRKRRQGRTIRGDEAVPVPQPAPQCQSAC